MPPYIFMLDGQVVDIYDEMRYIPLLRSQNIHEGWKVSGLP